MASSALFSSAKHGNVGAAAGVMVLMAMSACYAPFGIGEPSTRSLENGVVDSLTAAKSLEIVGSYSEATPVCPSGRATGSRATCPPSPAQWTMDLQLVRPATEHVIVSRAGLKLEAIIFFGAGGSIPADAYFRGNAFLSQHMGSDPASRNLVKAAGNAWWKGSAEQLPALLEFTDGATFRSTFLGTNLSQRFDHVSVDGIDAVKLSGPRAAVFVTAAAPNRLLRLVVKKAASIDGISDADLRYTNFGEDVRIEPPTDVIDFSNLSTLPPIYTVVSVDASRCASPCVVSALLKNLGGKVGAKAPSTITFTMTDPATKQAVGSCQVQVKPDVGYNASKTVSCTITVASGRQTNAAIVTAMPENPGRG